MKQFIIFMSVLIATLPVFSQIAVPPREADKIVASITQIQGPKISGRYVFFTAPGSFRYAGIAFAHEGYKTIHDLERVVRIDADGKEVISKNHYTEDNYLLYAMEIPQQTEKLCYRMVFDGLWTTDPYNNVTEFDHTAGLEASVIAVPYRTDFQTETTNTDFVRFVYEGGEGLTMTVCGTFNNWDPYMYEMVEISPGVYQLELPLPVGTYYYTFMNGTIRYYDKNNPERVYTSDGRTASVLTIKG